MKFNQASFRRWINEPIPPHILAIFRIGFGLFMAGEMIYYMVIGLIRNMFFLPAINFKYDFLHWLKPLPEPIMHGVVVLLLIAALCIAAGIWFKWACRVFAMGYAYIFLLDKSIYNNHLYLFILLAILLSFTDADSQYSLNRKRSGSLTVIPRWQVVILQLQFVIVYFYGGIAKLTYDWIVRCEPMKTLVELLPNDSTLAGVLKNDFGIYILTYGGLALDLLSPLLLWYKPIRKWAILVFIGFHFMNGIIFHDIGIFPYVMLFSLILFYSIHEIPVLNKFIAPVTGKTKNRKSEQPISAPLRPSPAYAGILIAYFGFQLLFPLRGFFLPNELDWTTIGNRFSWRMKVDSRQIEKMNFVVYDPATQQSYPMGINTLINDVQMLHLSMDPRSVRDFSHELAAIAKRNNVASPAVFADIQVRYNGREHQVFVDPLVDLTTVEYSFTKKLDWVMPRPGSEIK